MEVSDLSAELRSYLFENNHFKSFKNFTVSFDKEEPKGGVHQSSLAPPVSSFLSYYFSEIVKEPFAVLSSQDTESSNFSDIFKALFYFFWRHLLRVQEIYWARKLELNISPEIVKYSDCEKLNQDISDLRYFLLVNLTENNVVFSPEFTLQGSSLAVIFNSPLIYLNCSDPFSVILIPVF